MGFRFACARGIGRFSTWALKRVFRRPAGNFPGKMALYLDPRLIGDLAPNLRCGSIMVCGTNGKTTVNNLIADVLEAAGHTVICNRGGANLDSGIATVLLQEGRADWGVFESDELWLNKSLPQLKPKYLLLLNLFQDQVDRVGEVGRIQESIAKALKASPQTTLVYNADDPLCAGVAHAVSNRRLAFGVDENLGLGETRLSEVHPCQKCGSPLEYRYRQYGQLGDYRCASENCDFARGDLPFAATGVDFDVRGLRFTVCGAGALGCEFGEACAKETGETPAETAHSITIISSFRGAYMVYNLLAAYAITCLVGCSNEVFQQALDAFDPRNGRLQIFRIGDREILLNLAKNPIGFDQNLHLIKQDSNHKAVAFFVNNKEGDGRDSSWLEDVDFEILAKTALDLPVFAGGMCASELKDCLERAGLKTCFAEDVRDVLAQVSRLSADHNLYIIANYTALPVLHTALTELTSRQAG